MLEMLTCQHCLHGSRKKRITAIARKSPVLRKTAYHHGDLRAQLVNAVRMLVEEKGPDRFSVSEACRAAGVSTAAPYRHFRDKQEMLLAVAIEGMQRLAGRMRASAKRHPTGSTARIAATGHAYVRFATKEPGVFRLVFGLTVDHRKSDEMIAEGNRTFGVLLEEVAAYFNKPEIDADVLRRGFALWTFVHGFSFLKIDEKVDVVKMNIDIDEMIRETTERLLA